MKGFFVLVVLCALVSVQAVDYAAQINKLYADPFAKVYAANVKMSVNSETYEGVEKITEYLNQITPNNTNNRFVQTGKIYTAGNTAHVAAQLFSEGRPGCAGAAHFIDYFVFDSAGLVTERRQLWLETKGLLAAELGCKEAEDAEEYGLTSEEQDLVQLAHDNHHVFERAQLEQFNMLYTPDATFVSAGDEPLKGRDAIAGAFKEFFTQARSVVLLPVTPIYVHNDTTACICTLFVVTETGCIGTDTIVTYETFDSTGKLSKSEWHFTDRTRSEFLNAYVKDCGKPRQAAIPAEDVSALEEDASVDDEDDDESDSPFDDDHDDDDESDDGEDNAPLTDPDENESGDDTDKADHAGEPSQ